MASILYLKSILWLAGLGGLGYTLLRLTAPSEEKIQEIKNKYHYSNEEQKKKALILEKLKEAANSDKAIYLPYKEDTKNK